MSENIIKTHLFVLYTISSASIDTVQSTCHSSDGVAGTFEETVVECDKIYRDCHPGLRRGSGEQAVTDEDLRKRITFTYGDRDLFEPFTTQETS